MSQASPLLATSYPALATDHLRGLAFVHGGINRANGTILRRLHVFDLTSQKWLPSTADEGAQRRLPPTVSRYEASLESLIRSARTCVSSATTTGEEATSLERAMERLKRAIHREGQLPAVKREEPRGMKRERDEAGPSPLPSPERIVREANPLSAPARYGHVGWVFNKNTLLIHGGSDAVGAATSDVFAFHIKTGLWECLSKQVGGCEAPIMHGHAVLPLHHHVLLSHLRRRQRDQQRRERRRGRKQRSDSTSDDDDDEDEDGHSSAESSEDDTNWMPPSQRGIYCLVGASELRREQRVSHERSKAGASRGSVVAVYVLCISSVVGTRWIHKDTNLTSAALRGSDCSAIMLHPNRQYFVLAPADPRGIGGGTVTNRSVHQGALSSVGDHTAEEEMGASMSVVDFFLLGGETPQGTRLHDLYYFNANLNAWRGVCMFSATGPTGERLPAPRTILSCRWNESNEEQSAEAEAPQNDAFLMAFHVLPKNIRRNEDATCTGLFVVGSPGGVQVVDVGSTTERAAPFKQLSCEIRPPTVHKFTKNMSVSLSKVSSLSEPNASCTVTTEHLVFCATSVEPITVAIQYSREVGGFPVRLPPTEVQTNEAQ